MLAAQAEGLATSPTTGWDEEKVKEAIGLGGRDDRAIGLVTAVGYPAEFPAHPGRAADRLVMTGTDHTLDYDCSGVMLHLALVL